MQMIILIPILFVIMVLSLLGFVWGIVLNIRYRNPIALRNAADNDKSRWALKASFLSTIPLAVLLVSYYLSLGQFDKSIMAAAIIGIAFPVMIILTRWDLERINNQNIKYSRKLKDSDRLRLNQYYDFLSPGDMAKFNQAGFPENGIPLLITQTLTHDEMEDQTRMIYKFLEHKRIDKLIFTLGFGAPSADMYRPRNIKLENLARVIKGNISQGKFRLGDDDLYIKDENKEFRFTLCHESDVHFSSKDISILEEVESIWMGMNIQVRLVYENND